VTTPNSVSSLSGCGCRSGQVLVAIMLICGGGCDLPGRPKISEQSQAARDEASFKVLFGRHCAGCHGAEGSLGPAPPLFDELFVDLIPEGELNRVISDGRKGTLMPAFGVRGGGHLTNEQVSVLVRGIKSHGSSDAPVAADAPPYLASAGGQSRDGDVAAGLKAFARACASCHGEHGEGTDDAGAINIPEVVGLLSDQALRRLIITGRRDLGMPSYNESKGRSQGFKPLTSQEVNELVSLLVSWRETAGPKVAAEEN
jgi:cytochrome c oxidase cbb3-type subunit III